jgi:hypothetical protein
MVKSIVISDQIKLYFKPPASLKTQSSQRLYSLALPGIDGKPKTYA